MRVNDFMYENNFMLKSLRKVLEEGRELYIDPTTLRVYKLLIAVEQLDTSEKKNPVDYKRTINSLKQEALRLAPEENLIFFDRIEQNNTWYFFEYLREEVKDASVLTELNTFARAIVRATVA